MPMKVDTFIWPLVATAEKKALTSRDYWKKFINNAANAIEFKYNQIQSASDCIIIAEADNGVALQVC